MVLSIVDTHTVKSGIFYIHVRRNTEAATPAPNKFGWLSRSGWNENEIGCIISGTEIKFYAYSSNNSYNGISFTMLHKSGRISTNVSNLTTVSSATPVANLTPSVTSTDIGTTANANKLAAARTIDGVDFDGSANITHLGTCSTAAAAAAKAIDIFSYRVYNNKKGAYR